MVEAVQIQIVEIGAIVLAALFFGILSSKLKFPSSIGYILAGVALGPLALNFLTPGEGIAQLFGEIGLLLLLFYLGLELSVTKFKESGALALILSIVEMGLPFLLAFAVSIAFGFAFLDAVVIGAMLTATSTVMVSKFMFDRKIEKEPESRLGLSILVVEDFFAILVLAFLFSLSHAVSFKETLLNGFLFVIAMFFIVSRVTRFTSRFFETRAGGGSVMTLFALAIGIVVSYFGAYLGLTMALGAYFAGFALSETPFAERIKREIGFMREFFILFFFVGFGTTVLVPSANSLVLVAALVASYVLAKFVAYGGFGTMLGLSMDSASKLGMMMIPIGEFSLIIAAAASPFVSNPSELISIAFMLTIASTVISPFLYDRSKAISALLSSIYPEKIRKSVRLASKSLSSYEKAFRNPALQTEFSSSLKSFVTNCIVALAIVYMSILAAVNFDLSFIPYLPQEISVNLIILPFVLWPVYKAINDLKFMTFLVVSQWSKTHFAYWKRHRDAGLAAAEVMTSFLLVLLGAFASIAFYYFLPSVVLVPVVFTLLAVMYLSKSFYSLFEQAEELEAIKGEGISGSEARALSREFAIRSKMLSQLNEEREKAMRDIKAALQAGKSSRARSELQQFKKRERKILEGLERDERKISKTEVRALSNEEKNAKKKALESYFVKQAPRILGEKRKAKKKR